MKLTAKVKLDTTEKERDALKRTLELANAACNDISQAAWDTKTFRQFTMLKTVPLVTSVVVPLIVFRHTGWNRKN